MMEITCLSGQLVQEGVGGEGEGLAAAPAMPAGLGVPSVAAQSTRGELSLPTKGTGHLPRRDETTSELPRNRGGGTIKGLQRPPVGQPVAAGTPFNFPVGIPPCCSPAKGSKCPRSCWSVGPQDMAPIAWLSPEHSLGWSIKTPGEGETSMNISCLYSQRANVSETCLTNCPLKTAEIPFPFLQMGC